MLTLSLLVGTVLCLLIGAFRIWAAPLAIALFYLNQPAFWSAIGLAVGAAIYFKEYL